MMIIDKEKLIKRWNEEVQRCEGMINMYESVLQDLNEKRDKGTVFSMHTIYYVMMMN